MFAGFASTTPTDTHSVYRTFHFVFGVEHILSDSALGHSTIRLLSFTSLRDCPGASCLRQPPPLPPVPQLSATHCPAGGFIVIYDSYTAYTAMPQAYRKHTTRTLHAKRGTIPQVYNYTPAQPHRTHRYA